MSLSAPAKRHEFLSQVASHAAEMAREHGISDEISEQVGAAVADRLAECWGGSVISIPKDLRYRVSLRDRQIFQEFNGRNHHELSRKYGISENCIYRIIRRMTAQHIDHNQRSLDL